MNVTAAELQRILANSDITLVTDGSLTYCDCRAGKAYYASLGNRYRKLVEEARKDQRMSEFAQRTSHPDIEAARRAIHDAYDMAPPPTVHGATEAPAPQPQEVIA